MLNISYEYAIYLAYCSKVCSTYVTRSIYEEILPVYMQLVKPYSILQIPVNN